MNTATRLRHLAAAARTLSDVALEAAWTLERDGAIPHLVMSAGVVLVEALRELRESSSRPRNAA